jgi:hypothetical protein
LIALKKHDFIAKQQAAHLKRTKENLQEGKVVVVCDFAENFAFLVQACLKTPFKGTTSVTTRKPCIYLFVITSKTGS